MKTRTLIAALLGFGLVAVGHAKDLPEFVDKKFGPSPGKPIEEHYATVTAKPEIQNKGDYSLLLLPEVEGRVVEVICGAEYCPGFATLPRDRKLTFTLWQTKQVQWHTADGQEEFTWQSEVETIKDGSTVLYDAAICPLHQKRMKRGDIEISYGLPMGEFLDALKDFSGGPGFTLGGCVVSESSPKTERGYICDDCVAAYERWEKQFDARREERKQKSEAEAQAAKTGG